MTAPPLPSAEQLAKDDHLCPICGHWCGRLHDPTCCERRWCPRTVVELRALVGEWIRMTKSWGKPLDKEAFDAWLTETEIEKELARLDALTDDEILAEARARGVDVEAQAERVKAMLLETCRKTRASIDQLMADPKRYRDTVKP